MNNSHFHALGHLKVNTYAVPLILKKGAQLAEWSDLTSIRYSVTLDDKVAVSSPFEGNLQVWAILGSSNGGKAVGLGEACGEEAERVNEGTRTLW